MAERRWKSRKTVKFSDGDVPAKEATEKESPTKAPKPEETTEKPAKVKTPAKEVKKEVDKENETTNKPAG